MWLLLFSRRRLWLVADDVRRDDESIELLPVIAVNDVLEFNGGKSFASSTVIIQLPLLLFGLFIPKNKTIFILIIFHLVVVHWLNV